MATPTTAAVSRPALHAGPVRVGRAIISYDRDERTYSVWAPGFAARVTRRFSVACDLATGWA